MFLISEQLDVVIGACSGALAGVLNIPQYEVRILAVALGSLIVRVPLPSQTASKLETMLIEDDILVRELGIRSTEPRNKLSAGRRPLTRVISKQFPNLSDDQITQIIDILLEEVAEGLNKGDRFGLVKSNPDISSEAKILSIFED